ncbi:MAG: response regulator [Patescibacteria group bacterium]|nr:response regulator [Patescibacteria group bacterium]MDD5715642.1 response regulator [Patescibacteria group bacterium]
MESRKKTILVVENVRSLVEALRNKLSKSGYYVESAKDGEEALVRIAAGAVDLIILDLIMPRLDGFAVLREMMKRNITIPVIVASNINEQEQINYAKALGVKHYIVKSDTSLQEILDRIKEILSHS